VAGGAAGTLSWALMEIAQPSAVYGSTKDGTATFDGLRLDPLVPVGGSVAQKGDSGGPGWGTDTEPPSVVSVSSASDGTTRSFGARGRDIRLWARDHLINRSVFPNGVRNDFTAIEAIRSMEALYINGPVTPPFWETGGGKLRQRHQGATRSLLVHPEVYEELEAGIELQGAPTGNNQGWAGIAFRFVDLGNYYYAAASEFYKTFKLVRVFRGSETTLAMVAWPGRWNDSRPWRMGVSTIRDIVQASFARAGEAAIGLESDDSSMPIGRVALFNEALADVTYDNFFINRRGENPNTDIWNLKDPDKWTRWFNADDPISGAAELEVKTSHPGVCSQPITIEAREVTSRIDIGPYLSQTSLNRTGLVCRTASQVDGFPCDNYEVRYYCP
jgi:hypothetical protein